MGLEEIRKLKDAAKIPKAKKIYYLPKKSAKKIISEKIAKEAGTDTALDIFFNEQRKCMVGVCQCGCGKPSQKKDDTFFRHCICHIFPKKIFKSIATHPLNWVERTFWEGHHTNFDEQGVDRWPGMADWDDIKEKFHVLVPFLTDQERATKFYGMLEKLIYEK